MVLSCELSDPATPTSAASFFRTYSTVISHAKPCGPSAHSSLLWSDTAAVPSAFSYAGKMHHRSSQSGRRAHDLAKWHIDSLDKGLASVKSFRALGGQGIPNSGVGRAAPKPCPLA
eukprot:355247-Chlamydomonas_euryale.AAC.4